MPIKAVIFDAYGTLVRNEGLRRIPACIVADHRLPARVEDVFEVWLERYSEAIQRPPFRTLRDIQCEIFRQVLRAFGVEADTRPYVELYFELTTKVELYPDVPDVLRALAALRTAIASNADQEHLAAWTFSLPVEFIVISESIRAYKPDPLVFRTVLERLRLEAHEVLHVGDSDVDDVKGAKMAGLRVAWLNRDGRRRRPDVPKPDFEIRDLRELPSLL